MIILFSDYDRNTHGGGVALGIKCNLNPVLRPEFLSSEIIEYCLG